MTTIYFLPLRSRLGVGVENSFFAYLVIFFIEMSILDGKKYFFWIARAIRESNIHFLASEGSTSYFALCRNVINQLLFLDVTIMLQCTCVYCGERKMEKITLIQGK